MKQVIKFKRESLRKILDAVSGFVGDGKVVAVSSYVRFMTTPGRVSVSATNLNQEITADFDSDVDSPMGFMISMARFYTVIKTLSDEQVHIKLSDDGASIQVKSGTTKMVFPAMSPSDFPEIHDSGESESVCNISSNGFGSLASFCASACEDSENRPILGANLSITDKDAVLISTDGHRMKSHSVEHIGNSSPCSIRIPKKIITEVPKILDKSNTPISISKIGDSRAFFEFNYELEPQIDDEIPARLATMCISTMLYQNETDYPSISMFLPKGEKTEIIMNRNEFKTALGLVSVFTNSRDGSMIIVKSEEPGIKLQSSDPSCGECTDYVTGHVKGEKFKIGVNTKYILDVLATMSASDVKMSIFGEFNPILIEEETGYESSKIAIVMPMRIQS